MNDFEKEYKSQLHNHGFVPDKITPDQYVFGSQKLQGEEFPDGHWLPFIPPYELQYNNFIETSNCFPYNTKILMEDLAFKRISEIKKGEYVISYKGIPQKVTNIFKRKYIGEFINLKVKGLFEPIICTLEHPILTEEGWKKAKDITAENLVYIPTTSNYFKDTTIYSVEKDKDFLWLLGLYLAEGNVGWEKSPQDNNPKLKVRGSGNGRGTICFSISNEEIEITEKVIDICQRLFDARMTIQDRPKSKSRVLTGYNTRLRDLLFELGGVYSDKKKLHPRMMLLEPDLQLEIVKGWFAGDGYLKNRKAEGITVSENLIYQIYRILLRNGIKSSISKRKEQKGKKQGYTIHLYGLNLNKLFNLNFEHTSGVKQYREKITDEFLLKKITAINKINKKIECSVYNLEVENDNSYIAENISVHNCTAYGTLNAVEILLTRKFKGSSNWNDDFSDFSERALGILAKTRPPGNTPHKVAEALRANGPIAQRHLPFDETIKTIIEYYSPDPLTKELKDIGMSFKWGIGHDWVTDTSPQGLINALKFSPLGVGVNGWNQNEKGLYYKDGPANHWVCLVDYKPNEYWVIYDSYLADGNPFKHLAWDYEFEQVKRYSITTQTPEILVSQKSLWKRIINLIKSFYERSK